MLQLQYAKLPKSSESTAENDAYHHSTGYRDQNLHLPSQVILNANLFRYQACVTDKECYSSGLTLLSYISAVINTHSFTCIYPTTYHEAVKKGKVLWSRA